MTAAHIVERNRANAQRSTGPRTEAGKAVVSQNAVKHGGLALSPVILGMEDPAQWEAHRAGMFAALEPLGQLEAVLAERVALALWRLGRLARAEQAGIVLEQERAGKETTNRYGSDRSEPEQAQDRLQRARARVRALERAPDLPDDAILDDDDAQAVIMAVASETAIEDVDELEFPFVPEDSYVSELVGWTPALLRDALGIVAEAVKVPVDELRTAALRSARQDVSAAKQHVAEVDRQLELQRLTHLLPERFLLDRLQRYESHLTRQWTQALHELERLRAARQGQPVLPPAALDVLMHGAETGESGFVS